MFLYIVTTTTSEAIYGLPKGRPCMTKTPVDHHNAKVSVSLY